MKENAITVKITFSELLIAGIIGVMRNVESYKNTLGDRYGANTEKDGWQINCMGCVAEMAWAKHVNKYWMGNVGIRNVPDVDNFYQIRSQSHARKHNAELTMHKKDNDDQPYILGLVKVKSVKFIGWLWGREGKQDQFWADKYNNNRTAYFVPKEELRPMADLNRFLPELESAQYKYEN